MKTIKQNITFLLMIFLLSSLNVQAQVDLIASVDVTPPLNNGQTFTYSLMSTGGPYRAIRIYLEYDPNVIQFNTLTQIFPFSFVPVNDPNTPGIIRFEAAYFDSDITTDEVLINIEFEVLDNSQPISIAHSYNPTLGTVVVNSDGQDALDSANDIFLETLNIDTFNSDDSLNIYPNPVSDILYIKTTNSIETIVIFSLLGKQLLKTTSKNIDVSSFQSGNYILKIQTEFGETIKKLVIN